MPECDHPTFYSSDPYRKHSIGIGARDLRTELVVLAFESSEVGRTSQCKKLVNVWEQQASRCLGRPALVAGRVQHPTTVDYIAPPD